MSKHKIVPIPPTDEMMDAWNRTDGPFEEAYMAMLAAAPAQPAEAPQPGAAYAALPDALEALQLKSCPCGATPTALQITGDEQAKWAHVSGDCCGEWEIEYRNDYTKLSSTEAMTLAAAAWNEAPRASHGQAPAAPFNTETQDQIAAVMLQHGTEDQQRAALAYASGAAPTADYDHGPQSVTAAEAARHVGKWLNERPNRPLDLRDVAMLCAHAQKAPAAGAVAGPTREQMDAAYAVLWPDSKCNPTLEERRRITIRKALTAAFAAAPTPAAQADSVLAECGNCFEGKSDFDHVCKHCGGSGKVADSVLEDAARYRWLTADHHRQEDRARVYEIATSMNVRGKGHIDDAIDAARAAQEGKSHDN